MISRFFGWLFAVKVSIGQALLALAATSLGVMAIVLKSKEAELHETRVDLLKSHLENEHERNDLAIAQANARIEASKERYEKALAHFNSLQQP